MSEKREFYAATVEEALDKASADLGIGRGALSFRVLDEGSGGFLGIGARDARIVVEITEALAGPEHSQIGEGPAEPSTEERPAPMEAPEADIVVEENDSPVTTEEASAELILAVDEFITTLVDSMGLDATVDAYDAGEVIAVNVVTEETGLFIGRKGETIDAVQYLLNVVVYRNHSFSKKIIVDAEGYRQRRREAIQGMAHRTARRAIREKRPLSLPPMPAAERRVVHLYLKDNTDVRTASEGEEEDRRVVVSPV